MNNFVQVDDPLAYWHDKNRVELVARWQKRERASNDFGHAHSIAMGAGLRLQRLSDAMYQLWGPDDSWLINIYPGHCRLHSPKHLLAPYLYVEKGAWTLTEVVWAAVEAQERSTKQSG